MRVPYLSLLAILGLYIFVTAPSLPGVERSVVAHVSTEAGRIATAPRAKAPSLPDPGLTPGAASDVALDKLCEPGYARSQRHTSRALKLAIYAAYRIAPDSGRYEIDHLIPIALGGADIASNLWPQRYGDGSAAEKDRLEKFLHREVCSGKIPLRVAQAEIAKDWRMTYRKYFGD
ncbi:MAG TPA: HNH endonuclease signature motif containing protein [Stellaceae bacterium]|nr:HNH endonuclease signature motif containing protein [Stellaceae bacterium]